MGKETLEIETDPGIAERIRVFGGEGLKPQAVSVTVEPGGRV